MKPSQSKMSEKGLLRSLFHYVFDVGTLKEHEFIPQPLSYQHASLSLPVTLFPSKYMKTLQKTKPFATSPPYPTY